MARSVAGRGRGGDAAADQHPQADLARVLALELLQRTQAPGEAEAGALAQEGVGGIRAGLARGGEDGIEQVVVIHGRDVAGARGREKGTARTILRRWRTVGEATACGFGKRRWRLAAALVASLWPLRPWPPSPTTEPLWEVGAVGGGGWIPDYPASSQNHFRALALPYAVYRGEIFRLGDRGAARGIVYDDQRIEIDLGLDAAFPVDSDDNDAREGMDNLDYLLELGPRVRYRFLPEPDGQELDASLAVRGVISTDFANWRYQGITINPALSYRLRPFAEHDFRLVASLSPFWGVDGLNKYFYEVKPRDERPGRPAYQADNGYIGTELSLGATWGPGSGCACSAASSSATGTARPTRTARSGARSSRWRWAAGCG